MRSIKALTAVFAFATAFAVAIGVPSQAQAQKALKLAHGATADQAIGKGMLKFAELVNQKSGGAVKVDTHLAGSLYSERTALEAMVNGSIDFAGASNANWAAFTDTLIFMDLPYVFKDDASFKKVMHGKVGDEIKKRFEAKGYKLLMVLDNGGFRDVVNNRRQVKVPADLKGLKMRTTASPVEIAMFRNWGAVPTAIDWAEVYNALGSGVVDGEFVMPTWLATARHYEVLKHATENQAVIGVQTLAMMKSNFDKQPPAVQKAILESAAEAQEYANKLDLELLEQARVHAKKLGVQFYKPTPAEMEQWRTTGRQIWKEFEGKVDKALLNTVLEAQK